MRHLDICDAVAAGEGSETTEHPIDPGTEPFPSIWVTPQWRRREALGDLTVNFDQCEYGAETKKGTTVGGNIDTLMKLRAKCSHRVHTGKSGGFANGKFRSARKSTYPPMLCGVLAALHIHHYKQQTSAADILPEPSPYVGAPGVRPNGTSVVSPPLRKDVWPETEAGCFLAWFAKALEPAAVPGGPEALR